MTDTPHIVPYRNYRDGHAAVVFLTRAFGPGVVGGHDDAGGRRLHAKPRHGNGVTIMRTADLPKGSPGIYLVVEDVKGHFATAEAAGASVDHPPERTEWGTGRYQVTDPEGHEWSFGSYQPRTTAPDRG